MAAEVAQIRVLTVDDHPLLREGIAGVLAAEPDLRLVGEAGDGQEAVLLHRQLRPDVTLMDLKLPGLDGVGAIQRIRRESPDARFVVLTTYDGDVRALKALKAGAQAYLLKSALRRELIDTIRAVMAGRRRIPADIAARIAEHVADNGLTPREVEILRGVAEGRSNKRIGDWLGISEGTVKTHMKRVLEKLAANDRTHAVTIALRRGILVL